MFLKLSAEEIISKIKIKTTATFLNHISLSITNVLNVDNEYLPAYYSENNYLGISFTASNGAIFLYLCLSDLKVGLNKGDEILFYFDNTDVLKIKLDTGNVKFTNFNMNIAHLNQEQLNLFMFNSIEYWKLSKKNGIQLECDNILFPDSCRIENKQDYDLILNYMATLINYNKSDNILLGY